MKRSTFYKVLLLFFGVSCYFSQVLVLKVNLFEPFCNDNDTELWPITVNSKYIEINQMVEPYEISNFKNNITKRIYRSVQYNSSSSSTSLHNDITTEIVQSSTSNVTSLYINNTTKNVQSDASHVTSLYNNNTAENIQSDASNVNSSLSNNNTPDKAQPSSTTYSYTSTINTIDLLSPLATSVVNNDTVQNYTNAVNTFSSTFSDQNYGNLVMVFLLPTLIILTLGVLFIIIYKKQQGRSFYQVRDVCVDNQETVV